MNLEALKEKYPKIFPENFYFGCEDGWCNIIDNLCTSLQYLTESKGDTQVVATQVKEKFGGLRFYIESDASDTQWNLIEEAEKASYSTCEKCGSPGTTRKGRWIKVLCDKCNEIPNP